MLESCVYLVANSIRFHRTMMRAHFVHMLCVCARAFFLLSSFLQYTSEIICVEFIYMHGLKIFIHTKLCNAFDRRERDGV